MPPNHGLYPSRLTPRDRGVSWSFGASPSIEDFRSRPRGFTTEAGRILRLQRANPPPMARLEQTDLRPQLSREHIMRLSVSGATKEGTLVLGDLD